MLLLGGRDSLFDLDLGVGVFVNLVPIFGAVFAVTLLGEPLKSFHLVAIALVVGGIVLAQRGQSADTKT